MIQVIANPISGRKGGRAIVDRLCASLRAAGIDVGLAMTEKAGDAEGLARSSCTGSARLIVAAGGDGTVHEIVRGVAPGGPPILVVPIGTENILGKYLGIRLNSEWLAGVAIRGRKIEMDVGRVNGERFLLVAGIGFDAEVLRRLVERRRGHISHWNYVGPIWRSFWGHRPSRLRVEVDGRGVFEGRGMAFVGNVNRYAVGLRILRDADPTDGRLDVCVMEYEGRGQLIGHAVRVLLRRHVEHRAAWYGTAEKVRVESDGEAWVQADGELMGQAPVEFEMRGERVGFVVGDSYGVLSGTRRG